MQGRFIVFEGGEGAGKDTQIDLLRTALPDAPIVYTREPGGTSLGKQVRALLLDVDEPISVEAEAFLFLADRAQHAATLIEPSLVAGKHVVSNRAFYSSIAYQIFGRNRHDLRPVMDLAHALVYKNCVPDLVIWLDLDPVVGIQRAEARGRMNRIDRAPIEVHQRIQQGFQEQFAGKPFVLRVDAGLSIEDNHRVILERIKQTIMV